MDFPQALRTWRTACRVSQLELAVRAGTTQRHVSFMESGRSVPGRGMVVRLAESLDLPLRDRNDLLLAAGFAPVYPRTELSDPRLSAVRTALEHVLAGHLPYPAIVVDRTGDLVAHNAAFDVLVAGVAPELLEKPANAYRIALHPHGMAPRIRNFPQWAWHVVERLRQAAGSDTSGRIAALSAELAAYVPELSIAADHLGFAVPLRLAYGDDELHLMTTVTTFATAVDVTLAELKLEAFLPLDEHTARRLTEIASSSAEPSTALGYRTR